MHHRRRYHDLDPERRCPILWHVPFMCGTFCWPECMYKMPPIGYGFMLMGVDTHSLGNNQRRSPSHKAWCSGCHYKLHRISLPLVHTIFLRRSLTLSAPDSYLPAKLRSQEPRYQNGGILIIAGCVMGIAGCLICKWYVKRLNKKMEEHEAANNLPKRWRYVE